jgi:hypothetical protein
VKSCVSVCQREPARIASFSSRCVLQHSAITAWASTRRSTRLDVHNKNKSPFWPKINDQNLPSDLAVGRELAD